MNLDELKQHWQRDAPSSTGWTRREDMGELRARVAKLRRVARARDLRETAIAAVLIGVFLWIAWGAATPLERIGAAITAAGCAFIIVWVRAAGRGREPDTDLPVAKFFRHELAYLDRQVALLRNVLWWYILPLTAGIELGFVGSNRAWPIKAICMLIGVAVAVVVYRLNQAALRTHVAPLRDEVARLLRELEA
jgi:hypothetical protein